MLVSVEHRIQLCNSSLLNLPPLSSPPIPPHPLPPVDIYLSVRRRHVPYQPQSVLEIIPGCIPGLFCHAVPSKIMFVLLYYNYYENENEKLSETEAFNEGTFVELFDTYIYIYICK